jgi:hypothetical protein
MFLATAGASGHLLGSDEKEIIYLVFGIIDLQNKEVSDHNRSVCGPRSIREIPEKHVLANCELDVCGAKEEGLKPNISIKKIIRKRNWDTKQKSEKIISEKGEERKKNFFVC